MNGEGKGVNLWPISYAAFWLMIAASFAVNAWEDVEIAKLTQLEASCQK